MTNNKVIFGFTGLLASGKGTTAKYLEEKYGAANFRFSTMLRDVAQRFHLEQSRDTLIKISEVMRATFGEDLLAKTIAKDAESSDHPIIVVEGIRRLSDIEHLRALPHFVLVEISADPRIRYERLIHRGENVDDTTKTYEQFLADHQRSTELTIPDVIAQAHEHINNDGTFAELHTALDALVAKYLTSTQTAA